ncbi:MAG: aldehyde dehydrogenase family protein [Euryarchaeota archaeon]|nr:aldehyde dehydrogenase family protein [Euryarchaeota archaeon]
MCDGKVILTLPSFMPMPPTAVKNIVIHNPATLEVVGELRSNCPEDLPQIIARARQAQEEWMRMPLRERRRKMRCLQEYVATHIDELSKVICSETGKPRLEAVNTDLLCALSTVMYSVERMEKLFRPRRVGFGGLGPMMQYLGRRSYIQPRPVGVVAIIAPWNYPIGIPFSQAAMAVAAGNAVVLKPSSHTPFCGLEVRKAFIAAGVPENLVQVVVGSGATIGHALVGSAVDRIIFTGSTAVGKEIMSLAAQRLTPVTLELGGNDPMIVMADADLERAAHAAVWGAYVNAGQTCVCVKRIYVQERVYERFLELFKDGALRVKIGYGWDDPSVGMGPLINAAAVKDMEAQVARAVEQGGKVLFGGRRPGLKGHFFEPTAIVDAPQSSDIVQQETFGPIVTIQRFRDEEEAIAMANDSSYALSGSVWTSDLARGRHMAERMSGGTIDVNNMGYTFGLASTPWGGSRDSGFGRTHGEEGFSELLEPHHVHVDKGRFRRELWWYPYDREGLELSRGFSEITFQRRYLKVFPLIPRFRRRLKGK